MDTVADSLTEVKTGSWYVFNFSENGKVGKNFIGRLVKGTLGELQGNFVKSVVTKNLTGYIYHYPTIEDRSFVRINHIIKELKPPKSYGRGQFIFNIHA